MYCCCTQRTFAKVVYLFHIRNYLEKSAFYLHESHIYDTDRLQMCYRCATVVAKWSRSPMRTFHKVTFKPPKAQRYPTDLLWWSPNTQAILLLLTSLETNSLHLATCYQLPYLVAKLIKKAPFSPPIYINNKRN